MENKYWNLFTKSGKIGDYLTFCEARNQQNAAFSMQEKQHEKNNQGSDFKGTEYRGAGQAGHGADG